MKINRAIHGFYKTSTERIRLENVSICSDLIQNNDLHYITLSINGYKEVFEKIDKTLETKFENYTSCTNGNKIFVKIPFRYGRFEVKYIGLSSSEDFVNKTNCNCVIELVGVKLINSKNVCCFKLIEFDSNK